MNIREEDLVNLEKSTLKIAKTKIVPSINSDLDGKPLMRMGTGGKFDNFFCGILHSLQYGGVTS